MLDFALAIAELHDQLIKLRHDLHAHPELAYEEKWTAARLLTELHSLPDLKIYSGLAGTGVVAVLNPDHSGPCVALRADMDALPIEERTGLPYASTQTGRMHACGHDGHMACLLGAAMVLAPRAESVPGSVKFVFQPAEENGGGGRRLVEEEGVLDNPSVNAAFALHGWPDLDLGQVMTGSGPVLAAATAFDITLRGRGGHAAYPQACNDVVLAAAHVITGLQSISSRWDPVDPVVVSVCHVDAGQTYNVLPDTCRLQGTIRGLRQSAHDEVIERVRNLTRAIAAGFGCEVGFGLVPGYPALVNDPTCARLVEAVATELVGSDCVVADPTPGMGAEDFAYFANRVPAVWYRLGVARPDSTSNAALHTPQYDFADEAIDLGVHLHCEIAQRFLTEAPMWRCG